MIFLDDLYSGSTESIRWKGINSRNYEIKQGVKQGSLISPQLYKLYLNDFLTGIEGSGLGLSIDNIFMGSPTCADDVTLLTNDIHQVQPMLNAAKSYADQHRYQLHPSKTTITTLIKPRASTNPDSPIWTIRDVSLSDTDQFTHLGLLWKEGKCRPDVENNIKKARRSAYALLHGINGIDQSAALKIIQIYVTPTLLHGLESAVLAKEDLCKIDSFYKKLIRQILSLPNNTANVHPN